MCEVHLAYQAIKKSYQLFIVSDYKSDPCSGILSLHILYPEVEDIWSSSSEHISSWMWTKDLHTFQMRSDRAQYGPRATTPWGIYIQRRLCMSARWESFYELSVWTVDRCLSAGRLWTPDHVQIHQEEERRRAFHTRESIWRQRFVCLVGVNACFLNHTWVCLRTSRGMRAFLPNLPKLLKLYINQLL